MNTSTDHPAALQLHRLAADCTVRRTRRSGPGGQNRNKVETAVVVIHNPTGVTAEASERRSQAENLRAAIFRLRTNLALGVRRTPAPGGPSALWKSRCHGGRLAVNPEHDDFPALLAEALDAVHAHGCDIKPAAEALDCTPSQLTRFLKLEARALVDVNARRREIGMHALH